MNRDINDLLKSDENNSNEPNKDNVLSNTSDTFNTISNLAKKFKSVFVVLYYINTVLIVGFTIFATIGVFANRGSFGIFLLVLLGGALAYMINIFSFGFIATIMKIQEDLEKLAKN